MDPKFIDLTGRRFSRLTVIERLPKLQPGPNYWLCRCDCGRTARIEGAHLRQGHTRSCGCYQSEIRLTSVTRHGRHEAPEYVLWKAMRQRCNNPNVKSYDRYGGRGIRVCERWNDFALFLADMGPRPSPRHSIERIDNAGAYAPENCRWATRRDQANNRSSTILLEYNGEQSSCAEWSRRLNLRYNVLRRRIHDGETLAQIIAQPKKKTEEE